MSIEIKNLTKIYGEQRAIDGLTFSIGTGEIVGFLGPNGAGKSTTMKILSGYIPPTSGSAYVLGMNISEEPLKIKSRVGYLPELNPLYNEMYITEYLYFNADMYGIKDAKKAVENVIEITGLSLERKKKIGQISKGYKQRVGLAQALLNDPDVLILDEPTSGLDPNQMTEIRKLIVSLGKNKTILLSTHIMQEVEAMCSRVIIINKGKIVADDLVSNIKNKMGGSTKTTKVKFRDAIDNIKLKSLLGVISLTESGVNTYMIKAEDHIDLPAILFKFAVESSTIIVEQVEINDSLESVFQELTKDV